MKLVEIEVENFKSFQHEIINFENFNFLVGANAAGKSNVISMIRFFSNLITYHSVDDSIAMLGGIEYIYNSKIGRNTPIKLRYKFVENKRMTSLSRFRYSDNIRLLLNTFEYSLTIVPKQRGFGYRSFDEEINLISVCKINQKKSKNTISQNLSINFSKSKKDIIITEIGEKIDWSQSDKKIKEDYDQYLERFKELSFIFSNGLESRHDSETILDSFRLILQNRILYSDTIKIYDFDIKKLKKSADYTSMKSLNEDGSNLPIVLKSIISDKNKKSQLISLIEDALPFIKDVSIENTIDKSISFKLKEKYTNKDFYASFLSDGTVIVVAIIVALFFNSDEEIIVLEEPEKTLHPQLLRKIFELAQNASVDKQIIITTHNPEFLRNASVEMILFAKRTEDGFTKIVLPKNSEMVNTFIENELGLDELFMNGNLGD